MGIGGISIWQLLIIALIIVLLFGTKKLRSVGTDLGGALKGFKKAVKDDDEDKDKDPEQLDGSSDEESTADADKEKEKESTVSARTEHSDKK